MEANSRARRRLYQLASHIGPDHKVDHSTQLSTLACSAWGRDGFIRRDNRTLFARQSSESHGQFMRMAPLKQDIQKSEAKADGGLNAESGLRLDDVLKSGSSSGSFKSGSSTARDASNHAPTPRFAAIEPVFARPVTLQADPVRKEVPAQNPETSAPDDQSQKQAVSPTNAKDQMSSDYFVSVGFEWFPRMDVVESGTAYVITVELPGVNADGIRVEVVRSSLIVTGSRATDWWKTCNNGNGTVYHRRELAQGPYRAAWRLPKNIDINGVTAEFVDGFLRVLVPKIKVTTYL